MLSRLPVNVEDMTLLVIHGAVSYVTSDFVKHWSLAPDSLSHIHENSLTKIICHARRTCSSTCACLISVISTFL